jgi:hypothetical protein
MGLSLGEGSLVQKGMSPHHSRSRCRPGLGMLADHPVLLARRAVVAGRRRLSLVERLDQGGDLEPQDLRVALLRDAAAHDSRSSRRRSGFQVRSRKPAAQDATGRDVGAIDRELERT